MSDSSASAPENNTKPGPMFPVVRRNGFDPPRVLEWVKEAKTQIADLQDENDSLQARVDTLEQMLGGELDDETLVTALGDETVRVLLAARQSAADIRERAETHARQRMQEADEYAHRISTSAEHAVAAMTKEAEDRAAASREEATRAAARIHAEATRTRAEADAHGHEVRAEADETVRKARAEADETLRKAHTEADETLERAEADAAGIRRTATHETNDVRTRAEREARETAWRFQQERAQLLTSLRAARDDSAATLALLTEKREALAELVSSVTQLLGMSSSLADELHTLDVSVLGDDDLSAFEEDLGTSGLGEEDDEADDWFVHGTSAADGGDQGVAEGAGAGAPEAEDDELDDFDDEYDDELEDEELADDLDAEYDDEVDDEFDEFEDDFDELDEDAGAAADGPDAPGRSGSWAEPNGPPRHLGVAPWPNQREAG